jgi:hypothetical protein
MRYFRFLFLVLIMAEVLTSCGQQNAIRTADQAGTCGWIVDL